MSEIEYIYCKSGCGTLIEKYDKRGRQRYYCIKHNGKTKNFNVGISKEDFDSTGPHYCKCYEHEIIEWKEWFTKKGIPTYLSNHDKKTSPKITKEEFNRIKPRCGCPCNELISWKEVYKHDGIPKYIFGHQNIGKKPSEEAKSKMRANSPRYWKDKHLPEYMKSKISDKHKINQKDKPYNLGRKHTEKSKRNMSEAHIGKYCGCESPNWRGGISKLPYCEKWTEKLREEIRDKYNRMCFLCDKKEKDNITITNRCRKLSVHHIDGDKEQGCNNKPWFLVPLCIHCHGKTTGLPEYHIKLIQLLYNLYAIREVWKWWNSSI